MRVPATRLSRQHSSRVLRKVLQLQELHPAALNKELHSIRSPTFKMYVAAVLHQHDCLLTVSRENLIGITGQDFTIIAASKAAMRGATILKASDDKTRQLNKHTLMAFSGEAGDTSVFPRST